VEIEYEGAIAELNVKPLTATALTGLLAPQLAAVNLVNAPVICRERGIKVSETLQPEPGDYQMLMRITVTAKGGKRSIAGTVFAGDKPRLVAVDGMPLEAELGAMCCSCAISTSRVLSARSATRSARRRSTSLHFISVAPPPGRTRSALSKSTNR
jgi:hypothetical protein